MIDTWSQFKKARIFDLSQPMFRGMPQSPNHTPFRMVLDRRHGDILSSEGDSASNEIVVTGCHVGTHIDALSHVSFNGKLCGDIDANSVMSHTGFSELGIETVASFLCRGVLLDVAKFHGVKILPADYEITVSDLEGTLKAAQTQINEGDVVLISSGWDQNWSEKELFQGQSHGAPGIGEAGAIWLAAHKPRACGSETIAFEHIPAGAGHRQLPVHRVFLVENGIHIIETMKLKELVQSGVVEFLFVLSPLNLVGATGSPVRPLAVLV